MIDSKFISTCTANMPTKTIYVFLSLIIFSIGRVRIYCKTGNIKPLFMTVGDSRGGGGKRGRGGDGGLMEVGHVSHQASESPLVLSHNTTRVADCRTNWAKRGGWRSEGCKHDLTLRGRNADVKVTACLLLSNLYGNILLWVKWRVADSSIHQTSQQNTSEYE